MSTKDIVSTDAMNTPDFNTLFRDAGEWQLKTFPDANAISKLFHLEEEIKEIKEAITTSGIPIKHIDHEYADAMLLLVGSWMARGRSPEELLVVVKDKLRICKGRTWGKPDANGVVKHIKD